MERHGIDGSFIRGGDRRGAARARWRSEIICDYVCSDHRDFMLARLRRRPRRRQEHAFFGTMATRQLQSTQQQTKRAK